LEIVALRDEALVVLLNFSLLLVLLYLGQQLLFHLKHVWLVSKFKSYVALRFACKMVDKRQVFLADDVAAD
jgi:hypothetical protein